MVEEHSERRRAMIDDIYDRLCDSVGRRATA